MRVIALEFLQKVHVHPKESSRTPVVISRVVVFYPPQIQMKNVPRSHHNCLGSGHRGNALLSSSQGFIYVIVAVYNCNSSFPWREGGI